MEENEQNNHSEGENAANSYAKYSGVAFQMIATIGLFTFIGYEIDKSAHHDMQWVTALLSLTGVCLSIFFTIKQLSK